MLKDLTGGFLNGLNPTLLNGTSATLNRAFGSESLTRLSNGNFLISDGDRPAV